MVSGAARKKHLCNWPDCGKSFNRSDHLQRHTLNHEATGSTCPRCSAHFKRQDLLDRHMLRHQQKDEEAGGEGLGVVCTRKRLWRDAEGNIVTKRPRSMQRSDASSTSFEDLNSINQDSRPQVYEQPVSPPPSLASAETRIQDDFSCFVAPEDLQTGFDFPPLMDAGNETIDFFVDSPWNSQALEPLPAASNNAEFDDLFQPDTSSSFNMPFTTMNNYNWLFDLEQPNLTASNEPQAQANMMYDTTAITLDGSYNGGGNGPFQTQSQSARRSRSSIALPSPQSQAELSAQSGPHLQEWGSASGLETPPQSKTSPTVRGNAQQQCLRQMPLSTNAEGWHSFMGKPSQQPLVLDDVSRNRVLDLIVQAGPKTPEGSPVTRDHPLLTLDAMQEYTDLFFFRFNKSYPLIHRATFEPSKVDPLLLISVMLLGATYGDKDAHRLAVCIHDIMRTQVIQHPDFTATPSIWMLQVILLIECFGKSRAGQKQHDMSHLFHGMLINLIRRSDCQSAKLPDSVDGSLDLETRWRMAMDVEERKRLALLCFLWDTQHAVLFSQSLCMSAFELRTTLPCNPDVWEAESAAEWSRCTSGSEPSFLAVLKIYMCPGQASIPPQLNALSRLLILHGLMSVFWDMKRRDQTSLGEYDDDLYSWLTESLTGDDAGATGPNAEWKPRIGHAYDAWKTDFDTYCMNMTMHLKESPTVKGDFTRFSTSTLAIYHAAHIVLHIEILDLQIYAGARHIIGRPVSLHDHERSQWIIRHQNPTSANAAAWHAAQLLRDGIMNLEGWDVDQQFHYPWCLYLATLTCWAFHNIKTADNSLGGGVGRTADDESGMNALISSMTAVGPDGLGRLAGRQSTSGLINVVAKHLSNIRWAVVYEGMKVLRGLEPEKAKGNYDYMR